MVSDIDGGTLTSSEFEIIGKIVGFQRPHYYGAYL